MKKRAIALTLSLALLAGCSSTKGKADFIASYDGGEIPAGVFIYSQLEILNQFSSMLGGMNILEQSIGDESGSTMVNNSAKSVVERYAAVESEVERLGLEALAEDVATTVAEIERLWETEGVALEAKGVGIESVKSVVLSDLTTDVLFQAYYGPEGETPVTEQEMTEFYSDNYRKIEMVQVMKTDLAPDDGTDADVFQSELIKEAETMADDFFKRATDGEEFFTLTKEYAEHRELELPADATAEEYHSFVNKTGSGLPEPFIEELFATAQEGVVYQYDNVDYEIIYRVLPEDTAHYELNKENLLYEMRGTTFSEALDEVSKNINFVFNETALKEYTPESLVER